MDILTNTIQQNLHEFFSFASREEIQGYFSSGVFYKGLDYYESGLITDINFNANKTTLTALVKGSEEYTLNVDIQDGAISGNCTCLYGAMCKHLAAVLIFAINRLEDVEILNEPVNKKDLKSYLQSLSKDELINLVIKYAPQSYFTEIQNKFSTGSNAISVFKKVEKSIKQLFSDAENLYEPYEFKNTLLKQIKKLSGLEQHLKAELEDLILYIIQQVEDAFDEGYLYDSYNDVLFESSEEFESFVEKYIKILSYNEKIAFLSKLYPLIQQSSYSTFEDLILLVEKSFGEDDIPSLKLMLIDNYADIPIPLIEKYYSVVRSHLTNTEREVLLQFIKNHDSKWILELAELYHSEQRTKEAIAIIQKWLFANPNSYDDKNVYMLYLDLLNDQKSDLNKIAQEALIKCPNKDMLQKIASFPQLDMYTFETILEKKNPTDLLEYFQISNRLSHALALLNRNNKVSDSNIFDFFKKHKNKFPDEAKKYFKDGIYKNLEHTGDYHYYAIADHLSYIKQIDKVQAQGLIEYIRVNFKRRSKLMSIISKV